MIVAWQVKLIGSQNAREHWRARAKRVKSERGTAALLCRALEPTQWPVTVLLTRIGPRKLDSDNVAGCLKAVRDGVADALGVDDGDESMVTWQYAQARGPYGVRVELVEVDEDEMRRCREWEGVLP